VFFPHSLFVFSLRQMDKLAIKFIASLSGKTFTHQAPTVKEKTKRLVAQISAEALAESQRQHPGQRYVFPSGFLSGILLIGSWTIRTQSSAGSFVSGGTAVFASC
jgi:hypothetical protein